MNRQIFINCPFSSDYLPFFNAIVFSTIYCGFQPRCALETDDSSEIRFEKICNLVRECRLGIHDISKTELDRNTKLPRFNMPLELGVFLAAKRFGDRSQRLKRCLILDAERYRYLKFISDISGQDIHSHSRSIDKLIQIIARWLGDELQDERIPGGTFLVREYKLFQKHLPIACKLLNKKPSELSFQSYRKLAEQWIVQQANILASRKQSMT
jgi:hypothetical protein